jgi:hypothetical protein|tara:strand:- start:5933 stop:6163 length:231 start_codon:yes stop_codon:yes gene_type:complete
MDELPPHAVDDGIASQSFAYINMRKIYHKSVYIYSGPCVLSIIAAHMLVLTHKTPHSDATIFCTRSKKSLQWIEGD